MSDSWHEIIAATQASGRQAVLAITGGGSGAIAEVLRVPGGSRLLLEAVVPYDMRALASFLGAEPAQACSVETAAAMARRARARAEAVEPAGPRLIGVGATAALVTDRPRQGEHRAHIAVSTATGLDVCSIVLAKGRRDRAAEEDLVARAIVLWLAKSCGVAAPSPRSLLDHDEGYAEDTLSQPGIAHASPSQDVVPAHRASQKDSIGELVAGRVARVTVSPDGSVVSGSTLSGTPPRAVIAGSFNPLHDGHELMARVAEEMLGCPVVFELSVVNVDKPPLTADAVLARVEQFAGRATVELTRAPTFLEKSRLFPGATFVIGADTAERLVAVRYYGDETRMAEALDEMGARGCRFLVAARADSAGRLHSLADAAVPPRFTNLFAEIPESRFRLDVSSTEIRARATRPGR